MQRSITRLTGFLVMLGVLSGCGGEATTEPGGNNGGTGMSARVDGQSWVAEPLSLSAIPGQTGTFTIVGAKSLGTSSQSITLSLYNIGTTGTHALGVTSDAFGGRGSYGEMGAIWSTPNHGAAGTVTITVLTSTRIAGTFEFTATPGTNNPATVNHVVTQGKFDLPLKFAPPAFPANAGKKVSATLNGVAWNASSINLDPPGIATFGFTASNRVRSIDIKLSGVTAPGTYAISHVDPRRTVTVYGGADSEELAGPACCWGLTASDQGSVTITSIDANRVIGTFSVTLGAQANHAATTPMVITNGVFNIGLRQFQDSLTFPLSFGNRS